jgi:hypothetical protein
MGRETLGRESKVAWGYARLLHPIRGIVCRGLVANSGARMGLDDSHLIPAIVGR